MQLNDNGVNALIKANILSDDRMREIGFTDINPSHWYFSKMLDSNTSFNVTIPKDGTDISIDVLDESFCQPYDYQYILEKSPTLQYALAVKRKVEHWMKYLADNGVLAGHEEGDYI